jgi:hypothetical protein
VRTPYVVGPPVRMADGFFGRSQQARQFFETMDGQQVQCVSVLGLRRAGKTSFLQYVAHPEMMAAYLQDPERYVMVYVDMSVCKTPADFYTRVHRRLASRLVSMNSNGKTIPQPATDVYGIEALLYEFQAHRVVILMDEFDQLRIASFGQEFMTELRGLSSVWDYELGFVTASYWDLYRLGNFVGLPITSPFYNIFYPKPIYLSGLSPSELEDLVRIPARRVGVAADDEDIAFIRRIGGSLPFFVQATAAVWLPHKIRDQLPDSHEVTQRLASEMSPYFDQWWRNFSDVERDVLLQVVFEKPIERLPYGEYEVDEAVHRLINYGLISTLGHNLWLDSAVFCRWLREYAGRTAVPARTRAP